MTRHVQTTLESRKVTKKKGFNPEDPLFALKPESADVRKGSLKVDEVIYSREKTKSSLSEVSGSDV